METAEMHGKVARFLETLEAYGVAEADIAAITEGAETLGKKNDLRLREWFRVAMDRMDERLDADRRKTIREACACCKTGSRQTLARKIFKENDTLEARFEAVRQTRKLVGHDASWCGEGRILVRFAETPEDMRCPCLKMGEIPMSATYCQCCGGHIKHHLETALGVPCECTMVSSLQASAGREICAFEYQI